MISDYTCSVTLPLLWPFASAARAGRCWRSLRWRSSRRSLGDTSWRTRRAPQQKKAPAPVAGYRVVKVYPHDRQAFTQGLQYVDGDLYEGTGQNGQSGIRKVKLETGEVLQHQPLDAKYFGEGITVWSNTIVQLTWQSEIGFVYDKATFKQIKTFSYTGEGWGLTHDGTRLIMSDGIGGRSASSIRRRSRRPGA